MVSLLHEGLLAIVRDRPAFVADLLTGLLDVPVPRFTEARLTEATLTELVPVEYHADAVVLLVDNKPVFGVIVEAQLHLDERKHYTWPLYAIGARARHECPFVVVVVTPETRVATWASRPIELGGGSVFRPHVVGPDGIPQITDPERARRDPQLALLSVMAHGEGDAETAVRIALAAVSAGSNLPRDQQVLYSALILNALSDAARKVFVMLPEPQKFFSEAQRHTYDKGIAEGETRGEARGEAKAVLMVLAQRGVAVTDDQRHRIQACTDLATLDRWIARALSVASGEELLA